MGVTVYKSRYDGHAVQIDHLGMRADPGLDRGVRANVYDAVADYRKRLRFRLVLLDSDDLPVVQHQVRRSMRSRVGGDGRECRQDQDCNAKVLEPPIITL